MRRGQTLTHVAVQRARGRRAHPGRGTVRLGAGARRHDDHAWPPRRRRSIAAFPSVTSRRGCAPATCASRSRRSGTAARPTRSRNWLFAPTERAPRQPAGRGISRRANPGHRQHGIDALLLALEAPAPAPPEELAGARPRPAAGAGHRAPARVVRRAARRRCAGRSPTWPRAPNGTRRERGLPGAPESATCAARSTSHLEGSRTSVCCRRSTTTTSST